MVSCISAVINSDTILAKSLSFVLSTLDPCESSEYNVISRNIDIDSNIVVDSGIDSDIVGYRRACCGGGRRSRRQSGLRNLTPQPKRIRTSTIPSPASPLDLTPQPKRIRTSTIPSPSSPLDLSPKSVRFVAVSARCDGESSDEDEMEATDDSDTLDGFVANDDDDSFRDNDHRAVLYEQQTGV